MELGEPTDPEVSPEPTHCKRLQQRLQKFVESSNSIDSAYDVDVERNQQLPDLN